MYPVIPRFMIVTTSQRALGQMLPIDDQFLHVALTASQNHYGYSASMAF